MTDLQLSVLLEQIGNRLDAELRVIYADVVQVNVETDVRRLLAGAWAVRTDLFEQAHRLSGNNLPPSAPEL